MNKYIFSVDGNIGSGKSTLLTDLKKKITNIEKWNIVYLEEPVDTWNTVVDISGKTILEKYYSDPVKYSFSFQMMAYITRLSCIRKALKEAPDYSIIITERCLHTDYNIFAKMLYESGKMDFIEYTIYCKWFYEFIDSAEITGFIYLRTPPDICYSRIESRNRKGEGSISLEYLENCHSFHQKWLIDTNCLYLDTVNELTEYQIINFILKSIR
jgi:deoxyadenosine/deoxycytidine kinase